MSNPFDSICDETRPVAATNILRARLNRHRSISGSCKKKYCFPFVLPCTVHWKFPLPALPSSTTPAAYICQARSVHAFPTFPAPRHSSIVAMLEGRRGDLAQQFSLPALTGTHEREPRFALTLGLILWSRWRRHDVSDSEPYSGHNLSESVLAYRTCCKESVKVEIQASRNAYVTNR